MHHSQVKHKTSLANPLHFGSINEEEAPKQNQKRKAVKDEQRKVT